MSSTPGLFLGKHKRAMNKKVQIPSKSSFLQITLCVYVSVVIHSLC